MKLYKSIRFLMLSGLLTLVLSRCIRESLEGCPLDTLLRFTYKPRGSAADLFGERVQRVRLCVYRPDGSIEHMQTLEKSELDRLQGVEMYLPQGNYTVVLWANASDAQTKLGGFSEGETIRNLSASHPHAETSASIPTLDRLLFAVTPLTVSEHETGDHTVNFSPGTIRVSLHLDGVSVQPVVHITGMESALRPVFDETSGTWRLQSVSRNKTFQPAVAYDVTNRHANATTDIPRFKADTPGMVEIIDPTTGNHIVPPISLAGLIARYHIPMEEDIEVTIPIEITFTNGHAKITIRNWENQNVKPRRSVKNAPVNHEMQIIKQYIMPSSSIIIPFRNLLSVLLLLPLVLSCRQDELILPVPPVSGKGETAEVTLSVRIPDFRAANTRGVDEKGITEITVLMFADEGGTEKVKVKYDILGSSLHTLSGSSDTKYFSVPVIAGRYKRIALIANAQTELANITAGSTYDALKQVEVVGRFGQEGTGTYIPMYGEHAPAGGFELKAGVSQTIAQEIPLIRMLAKVDIINPTTSGATTAAGKVYFVNSVGNGRVWVDLATYNTTASQSGYMTPTLPATSQPAVSGGHPLEGTANTASANDIT